jgi:lysophospholipase L1-like esterase
MGEGAQISKARHVRRRLRLAAIAVPVVVLGSLIGQAAAGPVAAAAAGAPKFYLALGDSLARGVQPAPSGVSVKTNEGYVDDLYAHERTLVPGLRLMKLGCPGETTTTMISGGICSYSSGSQLAQADGFLRTHNVAFITIDIGANNVDGCVSATGFDSGCVTAGVTAAGKDLPKILTSLQTSAPGVPIFGMNYYDPFLSAWLSGATALATASVGLADAFNGLLYVIYTVFFGVPVADVAGAFQTDNFTHVTVGPFVDVPQNVVLVCTWTWMCVPPPRGPNIHANDSGYVVIAKTFESIIP